ncbi:MAG: hypothetical protein Q7K54_06470 [Candidatus Parcubacteria bacterium]|nr:hypothetical protein [Candidatus Parcubacteria bacterium]
MNPDIVSEYLMEAWKPYIIIFCSLFISVSSYWFYSLTLGLIYILREKPKSSRLGFIAIALLIFSALIVAFFVFIVGELTQNYLLFGTVASLPALIFGTLGYIAAKKNKGKYTASQSTTLGIEGAFSYFSITWKVKNWAYYLWLVLLINLYLNMASTVIIPFFGPLS